MKNKRMISYAAVIMWMALIFMFSMQNGEDSSDMSGRLVAILKFFGIGTGGQELALVNLFIRKAAHMTEYAILFLLIANALSIDFSGRKVYLYALLITIGYAAADEFHQLFVPGRAGTLVDVVIDSIGAGFGTLIRVVSETYGFKAKRNLKV
ncbi:VanZ family protein [Youngiibacter fragilis]|uniref:Phosphotransbutyrylase n=1 Tax=Youngiibacter fragilis 232.1 TaxID=994573 RepID=V7I106_9CLOT|nr:VanZ family protein [Youngiibacter fragilis]ETA78971.1 phosphotransbutyrylase [Youngiibacter fragilis 232.1]